MEGRGSIAQVKQQDFLIEQMVQLTHQTPFLLDNAGVSYPPTQDTMNSVFSSPYFSSLVNPMESHPYATVATPIEKRTFEKSEYNVATICENICLTTKVLTLEEEK